MKLTRKEKLSYRLRSFSKKNLICKVLAAPILGLVYLFDRIRFGLKGNAKKIGIALVSILFCPVFSSFSFGNTSINDSLDWDINFGVIDDTVKIAEETDIPSDTDILAVAEELGGEENENSEITAIESGESSSNDVYITEEMMNEFIQQYGTEANGGTAHVIDPDESYSDYEFDPDDWRIILINKSHFIPEDYEVPLGTITGWFQCDERILGDLADMFADAKKLGYNLVVRSPYRVASTQVTYFTNRINKYMNTGMCYLDSYKLAGQAVTIPGASEHEAGLSLDITSDVSPGLSESFGDTAAGRWMAENAHYYGFIVRYPADKEYITTIEYEPWHFRYVGVEAATVMYNEKLTLEEFWEKYLD